MNKTKVVLDTSFISSLLNSEDLNHKDALDLYSLKIRDSFFIIPFIVSIELLATIRHENLKQVIRYLKEFNNHIRYPGEITFNKFTDFIRSKKIALKSNDLFILFTAIDEEAELITFDSKLNKEYKKIINTRPF